MGAALDPLAQATRFPICGPARIDAVDIWVIVVAAGTGARFGAPKQFSDLAGVRVLDRAVLTASAVADGVVVVLPHDDHPPPPAPEGFVLRVVHGAATRSGSVRCGLAAVPDGAQIVVVHDAARPLASRRLYADVIAAVRAGADAAVPAVEITDTIRRRDGATIDRAGLVAVQTPQGFSAPALRRAHRHAAEATDDASLVEQAGGLVVLVDGDRHNIKITTPVDMAIASALMESCAFDAAIGTASPEAPECFRAVTRSGPRAETRS